MGLFFIVFVLSSLLIVLQLAANLLSPRIISQVLSSRPTKVILGIFTFAFVITLALLAATAQTLAHAEQAAPNADKRAVSMAVQRDAKGNQSTAAAGSLALGSNAWVQAGVGQSRSRDEVVGTTSKPVSLGGSAAVSDPMTSMAAIAAGSIRLRIGVAPGET